MNILDRFRLTGAQAEAAERLETHLAVTAGAGSGKTRALVARFLKLIQAGVPMRRLIAITFTEKAAREMRARIRREIEAVLSEPGLDAAERTAWEAAFSELDAARIGTIHGLCADLLRLHPAEAGVDPGFTVLEEGRAALLRAQATATALAWAGDAAEAAGLFALFTEAGLQHVLATLFSQRLEAGRLPAADPLEAWGKGLGDWLAEQCAAPAWTEALRTLAETAARRPDDKLETARRAVLAEWSAVRQALAAQDWEAALAALRALRAAINSGGQKGNWDAAGLEAAREAMRALRACYDEALAPVARDGRWALDQQAAELLPGLRQLFARALAEYQALKDQRQALDFDDLEAGAVQLLGQLGPAAAGEADAVLVDEFQDTNERQRQIVYALAGFPAAESAARLFVVGDAKQSIYRFRQADVAVFRSIHADLQAAGGRAVDLDLTFRAHAPLLEAVEAVLAPLMAAPGPARPHHVPFSSLRAIRHAPRADVGAPYLEVHLGLGANAEAGRRAAAAALAGRLRALQEREGFGWHEMALLFRASTAFPVYEEALEAAGLPYVTVAGRGFYGRPEVRDLLNALAALADPRDDLALAGLLRSPAFALTDADLYRLRFPDGADRPRPLFASLSADPRHSQAAAVIHELHDLAGRLPVADLLQRFLDATHYRAVLRAGRSPRLARNVDKLVADARRSRLVTVADFLEYVAALRDVGAREGEAPADPAGGGGAIQLMTIHKAKGLEFPLVVLADAGYAPPGDYAAVRAAAELGWLIRVQDEDGRRPAAWQVGAALEAEREAAEEQRLLYVALTRAQEKVIISGAVKLGASAQDPGQLQARGWLADLIRVLGLSETRVLAEPPGPAPLPLAGDWRGQAAVTLHPLPAEAAAAPADQPAEPAQPPPLGPLVQPYWVPPASAQPGLPDWVGRIISPGRDAPARVVGTLAHEALRRWRLNLPAADLDAHLRPAALAHGLVQEGVIRSALREARRLVERFRAHPLFTEIDGAVERYHELPYAVPGDSGVIDALYRTPVGWTIVDFKTDELRDEAELRTAVRRHTGQLRRYQLAVQAQLRLEAAPRARLVFLNAAGQVHVEDLPG